MFQQSWVLPLIALVVGFILGWLIIGLPARRKADSFQSSAQELDWKLKDANKALGDAQDRADHAEGSLATARSDLADANSRIATLQNELTDRDGEWTAQGEALAAREAELSDLRFQFTTLRGAVQQAQDALVAQLEPLRAQVAALTTENGNLKGSLEGLSADLARSRAEAEALNQALNSKDTALTEAYARAVRLQREVTDQQGQLVSSQSELVNTKRSMATLSATSQELEKRLQDARGEVAGELAVLTSTMLRVKDEQLAQANATIALLNAQLNDVRSARPSSK